MKGKQDSNEKTEAKNIPSFDEFLHIVPKTTLPIKFHCGLPDGTGFIDDFKNYSVYIPKSSDRIFGAVKSKSKVYNLIIYGISGDDIYPTLFSFDNRGKAIDSLSLTLNACGGADATQIPNSFAVIKDDLTIELSDTTRLIHIPEDAKSMDDYVVDSLRISREVFVINEEGKFVKQ